VSATVFEELTDSERNWVQNHLDQVSLFIDAYSPADSGQPITGLLERTRGGIAILGNSPVDENTPFGR